MWKNNKHVRGHFHRISNIHTPMNHTEKKTEKRWIRNLLIRVLKINEPNVHCPIYGHHHFKGSWNPFLPYVTTIERILRNGTLNIQNMSFHFCGRIIHELRLCARVAVCVSASVCVCDNFQCLAGWVIRHTCMYITQLPTIVICKFRA